MKIIAGLGNPGKKYKGTRHNVGFKIIDEFAKENNFPEFYLSEKNNALISEKNNIFLIKPQGFMNQSGKTLKTLAENQPRLKFLENLIVVHDDIDLLLGKIRISKNRGSAGHKGVESIIGELKSKNFTRLRIGIQPKKGKPENMEKFVLKKFIKEEKKIIKETIKKSLTELAKL